MTLREVLSAKLAEAGAVVTALQADWAVLEVHLDKEVDSLKAEFENVVATVAKYV